MFAWRILQVFSFASRASDELFSWLIIFSFFSKTLGLFARVMFKEHVSIGPRAAVKGKIAGITGRKRKAEGENEGDAMLGGYIAPFTDRTITLSKQKYLI